MSTEELSPEEAAEAAEYWREYDRVLRTLKRIIGSRAQGDARRWTRETVVLHVDLAGKPPEMIRDALLDLISDEEVYAEEDGTLDLVPGVDDRDQLMRRMLRILATPRFVPGGALKLWTRAALRRQVDPRDGGGAQFDYVLRSLVEFDYVVKGRDGGLLVVENPQFPLGLAFFAAEPGEADAFG